MLKNEFECPIIISTIRGHGPLMFRRVKLVARLPEDDVHAVLCQGAPFWHAGCRGSGEQSKN